MRISKMQLLKYFIVIMAVGILSVIPLTGQERESFISEYRIGPSDLLEITVFELPELNQTVRVSEDGSITIPLIGKVQLEGMTKDEVEIRISTLLEENYIKRARVTVFIKEYQSKQVAVIGAVENPGMYELVGRKNLLQIISQAGGFAEDAADEIYVLRESGNGITANLAIDLKDLLIYQNQKLNIPLQPNDVINVPVNDIINIFVFGMVKRPGSLEVKMSDNITLLQAIAQAGGFADGAKKSNILIKRKDDSGKEIKIKVNIKEIINGKKPDIELRERDVVYVPESFW